MERKLSLLSVLSLSFIVAGCMPVNHVLLKKRYRVDVNRYEAASQSHAGVGAERSLEFARRALEGARRAIKLWDHERARTLLYLAEQYLDTTTNPPVLPAPLRELYAPLGEPFTPETPSP